MLVLTISLSDRLAIITAVDVLIEVHKFESLENVSTTGWEACEGKGSNCRSSLPSLEPPLQLSDKLGFGFLKCFAF